MLLRYEKEARRKSGGRRRCECNFPVAGLRSVQDWPQHMTDTKLREISMRSQSESLEIKVPIVCLVTGCVSRPRDGRYTNILFGNISKATS